MNLSKPIFHRAIVPPKDLFFKKGSSLSCLLSELSSKRYLSPRTAFTEFMSQEKICVSFRKSKSGEKWSIKCFRLKMFRFNPSMFQVRIESLCKVAFGVSGLSCDISLNDRVHHSSPQFPQSYPPLMRQTHSLDIYHHLLVFHEEVV